MKTLIIKAKTALRGKNHYVVPAKAHAGAGPVPSLQLEVGKETEVEVADQAHEDLLRADRNLEVVDEDGKHEKTGLDPVEQVLQSMPADARKILLKGIEQKFRQEIDSALDQQASAIAETKKQLDAVSAKQGELEKENAELKAAVKARDEELAKLKAPPPVDEKAAKDPKAPKGK